MQEFISACAQNTNNHAGRCKEERVNKVNLRFLSQSEAYIKREVAKLLRKVLPQRTREAEFAQRKLSVNSGISCSLRR